MTDLSPFIDHTALKPETTRTEIEALCGEAHKNRFAAACVMPYWVSVARATLDALNSTVALATTIGFPLGAHRTSVKVYEAAEAIDDGATELDMVMNIGALLSGDTNAVEDDIRAVAELSHRHGAGLKVILETALLSDDLKRVACRIAADAGADYVKTSTGFAASGATVADVRLMRASVPESVGVKASGGIRDRATALAMIDAGATRIGTSSGVRIVIAS